MSKCKITGKVLSIQLGREETQIVLMGNGSEILHSASVPTPEGAVEDGVIQNADAVRSMLRTALNVPEFKRVRQAVFSLCTSQVITETVTTPDLPAAKLEKLLQSNVDMYFPVDMQDYQLVWQPIGPKTNDNGLKELSVRLWAVPTAMVARYYAVANACGLSVAAIDYCGHSIATAVGATFARPVKKAAREHKKLSLNMEISFGKKKDTVEPAAAPVAVEDYEAPDTDLHITLEKDLLGMTFVQNGQVVLQRFIQCGAEPSYQFTELAMMLEYFSSLDAGRGSAIRGIVSGSLAGDRVLTDELSDMLDIRLYPMDADFDPRWIMCVGAAGTTLDFGVPSLNAPGKGRRQVQSQLWQYGLILAGGVALVAVILLTLSSRLVWDSDIRNLQNNVQTLTIQAQQTAGYADNYKKYASLYDNYEADWETVFASLQTYNDNLVLVLEELENTLPEKTSVTNLQIAADGLTVQFACDNKEEAAYLIMALRELQYAELNAISNLTGGGRGPATSYGSGESAPTEGSSATQEIGNAIEDLFASELDDEELMELALELAKDPEKLELLEEVYGAQPTTPYASLDEMKAAHAPTFEERCNALRTMLTTNPFAANRFVMMFEEDFYSSEPILCNKDFVKAIIELQESGELGSDFMENTETMQNNIEVVLDLLTRDEPTLSNAEALICTDPLMEQWYIYYLQIMVGDRLPELFPYLDMETVAEDLLNGGFETGDEELDEMLNGLISEETWELVDTITSEEGLAGLLEEFFNNGTTGDSTVDELIHQYLTTGSTGSAELDERIKACIEGGHIDEYVGELLDEYLSGGTTGSSLLDELIINYLTTGTTGNPELDGVIQKYIESGLVDGLMAVLFENYMTTGSTGNTIIDNMIVNYLTTGTTGNPGLDGVINRYLESGSMDSLMGSLFSNYLTNGTTGNTIIDQMIDKFLTTGTTGNPKLDAIITAYMNSGAMNEQMGELVDKYLNTGTTGNATLDALINQYLVTGTTGNPALDAMIEDLMNSFFTGDKIEELLNKYLEDGTTGNPVLDELINKYLREGTTGNPWLDEKIKEYMDGMGGGGGEETFGGFTKEELMDMFNKYLEEGTTGNPVVDKMIEKYLNTGSTGYPDVDKMIEEYIEAGYIDDVMEDLVDKYLKDGTTGNAVLDKLISKYLKDGTTGIPALDKLIEKYISGLLTGGTGGDSLEDLLNSILGGGGNGGNGTGTGPVDTRIFFTVQLSYNDELKNAELIRKGLSYNDKIRKLEVTVQ